MPEPAPLEALGPVPMWPATLPDPQAPGYTVTAGLRANASEVLFGVTRLTLRARVAPATFGFNCWLTAAQMEIFEEFYRDVVENFQGEFYARWIGGSRIVAFAEAYQYSALGAGYSLVGTLVRTRTDISACDDFINSVFGAIYRAVLNAPDRYVADLAATDIYKDDFSLQEIADNEC